MCVMCVTVAASVGFVSGLSLAEEGETWRGLTVAEEDDCGTKYKREQYRYNDRLILRKMILWSRYGSDYSYDPYTGAPIKSASGDDMVIDHIVALSEAHVSGLCKAGPSRRREFAEDLLNVTLTTKRINGNSEKGSKDFAEWMPEQTRSVLVCGPRCRRQEKVWTDG